MQVKSDTITTPQRVATALAVLLWAVGSAYLIQAELRHTEPDWVVIAATPLLWAVVIGLPILAHHAWHERRLVAAALLSIAAVVGTAYTLNGTIGRQAEARDTKNLEAAASGETRKLLEEELTRNRVAIEAAARQATLACKGKAWTDNCQGMQRREKAYQARVDQLMAEIGKAAPAKPKDSGTRRVTQAIALVTGKPEAKIEPWVATFGDALLGLVLEVGALALGYYAMGPGRTPSPKSLAPVATPSTPRSTEETRGLATPSTPLPPRAVIPVPPRGGMGVEHKGEALDDLLRLLARGDAIPSQDWLAERWGRSKGRVSLWLKEWTQDGEIPGRIKVGKCKTFEMA